MIYFFATLTNDRRDVLFTTCHGLYVEVNHLEFFFFFSLGTLDFDFPQLCKQTVR